MVKTVAAKFRFAEACQDSIESGESPPDAENFAPRDGLGPGMRDSDRPLNMNDYLCQESYALFGKKAMDFITQTTPTVISHKPTGGGLKGGAPAAAANPAPSTGGSMTLYWCGPHDIAQPWQPLRPQRLDRRLDGGMTIVGWNRARLIMRR